MRVLRHDTGTGKAQIDERLVDGCVVTLVDGVDGLGWEDAGDAGVVGVVGVVGSVGSVGGVVRMLATGWGSCTR